MNFSLGLSPVTAIYQGANRVWPIANISITSGSGYAGSVYTSTIADQWYTDDVPIPGETGSTFTMTVEHEGAAIRCGNSNIIEMLVPSDFGVDAFDARQGLTLSGSSVTRWDSMDGAYYGTQETSSYQPTYDASGLSGNPAVVFDGGESIDMIGMDVAPASRTVVCVASFDVDSSKSSVFGPSAIGGYLLRMGASNKIEILSSSVASLASSSQAVSTGAPLVFASRITAGSNYDFRDGGISIGSGTVIGSFNGDPATMRIGKQNNNDNAMDGDIAFLASVDSYMSDSDLQKLEGIAAHITGTTGSLDPSHPYKNAAPMVTA